MVMIVFVLSTSVVIDAKGLTQKFYPVYQTLDLGNCGPTVATYYL